MRRRTFISGAGATAAASSLGAPSVAQPRKDRTLIFVPAGGLSILDPSFSTVLPTTNHGYYIFDTLYSVDSKFRAVPQMAEGHTVSDDNLTWTIKLRPGLKFHDGEPVLARDCVASIKRWGQRDGFGASLLAHSDEISAADDKTIRFRLKKPFNLLPDALAHPVALACFIMPERMASSDINKAAPGTIGSGPFRFVAGEFVAGQRAVYDRNPDYVPRQEKPDYLSGGKVVHFDRVEWQTIPDFATASAALQAGEVDWWENVQFDLAEQLKRSKGVTVATADPGYTNFLRFNCGVPPFNNPALRRAVAAGIVQTDYTQALVGSDTSLQQTCYAMYRCGLPGVEELGKGLMDGEKDFKALAEQVKKAGYKGEKVVLLNTADLFQLAPMGPVLLDALTKMGLDVDLQAMDLGTIAARRQSQAPVAEGGWSMFTFLAFTPILANPVVDVVARGLGPKGYPGNYNDPELEADIAEWIAATSESDRFPRMDKVHKRLWDMMPIVPLGSYSIQTAFRSNLTGYIPAATPLPWNIRRV